MTSSLDGRVAVITGAARGQGRAIAVRLAQGGANIIGVDVCGPIENRMSFPASTEEELRQTAELVRQAGGDMLAYRADTRSIVELSGAVSQGLSRFGKVDMVIANAGVAGGRALVHELSEDDWRTTLDINLTGVWNTVRATLPAMIEAGRGGCMVLTSSAVVKQPKLNLGDYGAAKAGVTHLARTLALENGVHNIRVNSISPGNVDTPLVMNEATYSLFRPDLESPAREDVLPLMAQMRTLNAGPMLASEDIAGAVAWLVSDDAARITGADIAVDMGWHP